MKKLAIFDYSTCTVHFFDIEREEPFQDDDIENLGFDVSECSWMAGDIDIIYQGVVR